jgi:ubiquinone/menaquinone biosynthesis C-methylase UbiE
MVRLSEPTIVEDEPSADEQTHVSDWQNIDKVRTCYDVTAEMYSRDLADDMVARPLERGMFQAFSELVGPGTVGDVGCGPGHVAKHLASLGMDVLGVDVSPAMLEQAKRRWPDGKLQLASMYQLPFPNGAWAGAISLYATLHCTADERRRAYRELARVVRPGGYVMHGFYVSAQDLPPGSIYHLDKWFGYKVDVDVYFHGIDDAAEEMTLGGFEVVAALVREPLNHKELPTRRCYMLGKRR